MALLEDLEVDGDQLSVGKFDQIAGVGIGDFDTGDGVEPAVVAFRFVALGQEPIGYFRVCRLGALDVGLGDDEGGALCCR